MNKAKLLIVDDDEDVLLAASMLFKAHVQVVHTLSNTDKLMNIVSREKYDVIMLDMNFSNDTSSGREGFFWLRNILAFDPCARIILMTAYGDVERAVKAIKEGAFDYVLKPWQNDKLISVVVSVLDKKVTKPETKTITISSEMGFIGQSQPMKGIFETIRKVAPTQANILITGENGTGKELVANELHKLSDRTDKIFVPVDMGSLSESVFESELFGHVKGAFTDAREDRIGRFESASGGTIFLDEIGNLTLSQQAKLLTVIQHKQITRLGSNKVIPVDVRIIAATNVNLQKMIEQQSFRQDLLYRLNTVEITIPPLRERKEDLEPLLDYFLDHYSKKYDKTFASGKNDWVQQLQKYDWPGNVRELRHTIERAVIMSDENDLTFNLNIQSGQLPVSDDKLNLDELEKTTVLSALKKHEGNVSRAASDLGLTRPALYRRMEKYGL